jgi:hypothetical protein
LPDDSLALQQPGPAKTRGGRQADLIGEILIGDSPVTLQEIQNPAVDLIQYHVQQYTTLIDDITSRNCHYSTNCYIFSQSLSANDALDCFHD